MYNENNKIKLMGTIVSKPEYSHNYQNEEFYTVDLFVERESESVDILSVMLSDHIIPMEEIYVGMKIQVEGSIRTYNLHGDEKQKLKVFVFADSIFIMDSNEENNINNVVLTGYICKKGPVRTTPLGRKIIDVIIAVNRTYGKSDYIPCIFWGRCASYVDQLPIGTCITTEGRFQSREYLKNNEIHRAYEVSNKTVKVEKNVEENIEY